MADNSLENDLNETDLAILREVQEDGRISNVELANRIELSIDDFEMGVNLPCFAAFVLV